MPRSSRQQRHNVLLVGGGGREHALAAALKASPSVSTLWTTHATNPGIGAIARHADVPWNAREAYRLEQFCRHNDISLVVVGPEKPLAEGIADKLASDDRVVFGPTRDAARLEADKAWAKQLMRAASIPTAEARVFKDATSAKQYIESRDEPQVIKAAGLAAGKGVFLPGSRAEANQAIDRIMLARDFGDAGEAVVIEERLKGPEVSVFALVDGRNIWVLDACQDHKRLLDADKGPNTGGMGAYSPTPLIDARTMELIQRSILIPTVDALRREGIEYRGVLYAGLMLTHAGPKVLEYNVRFGDPECQCLIPRLRGDLGRILHATATGRLNDVDFDWDPGATCCVVLAAHGYPESPRKGDVIEGIDEAESMEGVRVFHAGTKRSGDSIVTNGGRVLNAVGSGDSIEQARDRAYAAADAIRFDGKQMRRDIAHQALGSEAGAKG